MNSKEPYFFRRLMDNRVRPDHMYEELREGFVKAFDRVVERVRLEAQTRDEFQKRITIRSRVVDMPTMRRLMRGLRR